jgi:hypothetical protein
MTLEVNPDVYKNIHLDSEWKKNSMLAQYIEHSNSLSQQ